MSIINKNTSILVAVIFATLTIVMIAGPVAQNIGDNTAFAKSKNKGNKSDQGISEKQSSQQRSQCVSGDSIFLSCNNFSFQDHDNDGNNAGGQQSGNKHNNKSDQKIEQDQDNKQRSQCVSGDEAIVSCNNIAFQNQINRGNNALG